MRMRIALATVALFAVASGIAYAAMPDADGTYHACMLKNVGTIRIIDPDKQHCSALETAISFGARGSQGVPGSPGPAGGNGISPTVAQLASGNANCPAGGAAITDAAGSTAYVCSGASGADGAPFAGTFTSPNGVYSIGVTDTGVKIASTNGANLTLSGTEVTVRSQGTVHVESQGGMDFRGGSDLTVQAGTNLSLRSQAATDVRSGTDLTAQAGSDLALKGSATATLQGSGATTVQGGGILALTGGLLTLNGAGSCTPVVRVTDSIAGTDAFTGQSFLTALGPGAATVCAG